MVKWPFCALVLVCLSGQTALGFDSAQRSARVAFEEGRRLFRAGEFKAALPHLQQAYRASGARPSTIRALAQCYRALEQYPEAIAYLREYLKTEPKDKAAVLATIAELEERAVIKPVKVKPKPEYDPFSVRAKTPREAEAIAPTPQIQERSFAVYERAWFWVVTSVVLAGAGVAVGLSVGLSQKEPPIGGSLGRVLHR